MSEDNQQDLEATNETVLDEATELASLKKRADLMGVKYSPNIGLETLRERVNEKLKAGEDVEKAVSSNTAEMTPKMKLRKEARKLHRVQISCRNPLKKEWEGEIFTVSNAVVGTVKRFVMFNDITWHVEDIILKLLQQKTYQKFYTTKDEKTGKKVRRGKLEKEFDIRILPQITEKELNELKHQQALAKAAE